jgi:DNA-binding NarL/FixJ family response regulator
MVVLVSKDLFFAPIIRGAAESCGMESSVLLNADSKKDPEPEGVAVVILDLGGVGTADLAATVIHLRERFPAARLVGYASHVHEAKILAAQSAGFDPVLSKGQVSANLAKYLQAWSK